MPPKEEAMNKNLFLMATAGMLVVGPALNANVMPTTHSTVMTADKVNVDLAKTVKEAIFTDKDLSKFAPNVDVKAEKDGVVVLSGKVDSEKDKSAIESKAKLVTGVTKVINNIEVTAGP
jgi:osmotically-inducible protein OsmY